MKTTIDIADDLLLRAKQRARERNITLRRLMEDALAGELDRQGNARKAAGMVVMDGDGLAGEFRDASWERIRNAAYGIES